MIYSELIYQHSLKKNEFLGEYTGELVSYEEAEERGRAERKNGFSYLFTLNDKVTSVSDLFFRLVLACLSVPSYRFVLITDLH